MLDGLGDRDADAVLGVWVGVGVRVGVAVRVGVCVAVAVGVCVGGAVSGVCVGVGVGVGSVFSDRRTVTLAPAGNGLRDVSNSNSWS